MDLKKGGLDLKASFITPLSCVVKRKEEMVGEGSDAYVVLGGLTGLESGITQTSVNRAEEGRFTQTCHSSLQGEGSAQLHR